jgi:hypothetical protein
MRPLSKVPRRNEIKFGHHGSTATLLDGIKQGILNAVSTQVLLAVGAALLPQFAMAIYAGYFAYKYGSEALGLKRDYDQMEGQPEEKVAILAAREGFKAGIGLVTDQAVGKEVGGAITDSVQATTRSLSSGGTFNAVANAMGQPDEANDLRYFFATTLERTLNAIYAGGEDVITDYVAKRVSGS